MSNQIRFKGVIWIKYIPHALIEFKNSYVLHYMQDGVQYYISYMTTTTTVALESSKHNAGGISSTGVRYMEFVISWGWLHHIPIWLYMYL